MAEPAENKTRMFSFWLLALAAKTHFRGGTLWRLKLSFVSQAFLREKDLFKFQKWPLKKKKKRKESEPRESEHTVLLKYKERLWKWKGKALSGLRWWRGWVEEWAASVKKSLVDRVCGDREFRHKLRPVPYTCLPFRNKTFLLCVGSRGGGA